MGVEDRVERLNRKRNERARYSRSGKRVDGGNRFVLPVILSTLLATAAVAGWCRLQDNSNSSNDQERSLVIDSSPLPQSPITLDVKPLRHFFPPSLAQLPTQSGEFQSDLATNVWYNHTNLRFEPAVARQYYSFVESLPAVDHQYKLDTDQTVFSRSTANFDKRLIFVLPQGVQRPNIGITFEGGVVAGTAVTTPDRQNKVASIYLNAIPGDFTPFSLASIQANSSDIVTGFATEIFNSTQEITGESMMGTLLGQEIYGNSYGLLLSARMKKIDYVKYANFATQVHMRHNNIDLPMIVFSENDYNNIPDLGLPFKLTR